MDTEEADTRQLLDMFGLGGASHNVDGCVSSVSTTGSAPSLRASQASPNCNHNKTNTVRNHVSSQHTLFKPPMMVCSSDDVPTEDASTSAERDHNNASVDHCCPFNGSASTDEGVGPTGVRGGGVERGGSAAVAPQAGEATRMFTTCDSGGGGECSSALDLTPPRPQAGTASNSEENCMKGPEETIAVPKLSSNLLEMRRAISTTTIDEDELIMAQKSTPRPSDACRSAGGLGIVSPTASGLAVATLSSQTATAMNTDGSACGLSPRFGADTHFVEGVHGRVGFGGAGVRRRSSGNSVNFNGGGEMGPSAASAMYRADSFAVRLETYDTQLQLRKSSLQQVSTHQSSSSHNSPRTTSRDWNGFDATASGVFDANHAVGVIFHDAAAANSPLLHQHGGNPFSSFEIPTRRQSASDDGSSCHQQKQRQEEQLLLPLTSNIAGDASSEQMMAFAKVGESGAHEAAGVAVAPPTATMRRGTENDAAAAVSTSSVEIVMSTANVDSGSNEGVRFTKRPAALSEAKSSSPKDALSFNDHQQQQQQQQQLGSGSRSFDMLAFSGNATNTAHHNNTTTTNASSGHDEGMSHSRPHLIGALSPNAINSPTPSSTPLAAPIPTASKRWVPASDFDAFKAEVAILNPIRPLISQFTVAGLNTISTVHPKLPREAYDAYIKDKAAQQMAAEGGIGGEAGLRSSLNCREGDKPLNEAPQGAFGKGSRPTSPNHLALDDPWEKDKEKGEKGEDHNGKKFSDDSDDEEKTGIVANFTFGSDPSYASDVSSPLGIAGPGLSEMPRSTASNPLASSGVGLLSPDLQLNQHAFRSQPQPFRHSTPQPQVASPSSSSRSRAASLIGGVVGGGAALFNLARRLSPQLSSHHHDPNNNNDNNNTTSTASPNNELVTSFSGIGRGDWLAATPTRGGMVPVHAASLSLGASTVWPASFMTPAQTPMATPELSALSPMHLPPRSFSLGAATAAPATASGVSPTTTPRARSLSLSFSGAVGAVSGLFGRGRRESTAVVTAATASTASPADGGAHRPSLTPRAMATSPEALSNVPTRQTEVLEPLPEDDYRIMVCVHGCYGGIGQWLPCWRKFAEKADVYAFDLPGFARSEREEITFVTSAAQRYSSAQVAIDWFHDYFDRWFEGMNLPKGKKVTLIAHSFGAYLFALYAKKRPELFEHLFLTDPWGVRSYDPQRDTEPLPRTVKALLWSFYTLEGSMFTLVKAFGPLAPQVMPWARPELGAEWGKNHEDGHTIYDYLFQCNCNGRPTGERGFRTCAIGPACPQIALCDKMILPDYPKKDFKISFIYAMKSRFNNRSAHDTFKRLAEMGADTTYDVVPDSGHQIMTDNPSSMVRMVLHHMGLEEDKTRNEEALAAMVEYSVAECTKLSMRLFN